MKKVTAYIQVKVLVYMDETTDFDEIVNQLDYNFADQTGEADIIDTEIMGYEVKDSR